MQCFGDNSDLSPECLEMVIETMAEGVLFIDTNQVVRYVNRSATLLFGYEREELLGMSGSELLRCASEADTALFREGSINQVECSLQKKDGTQIPVIKNGRVVKIGTKIMGAVETFQDISHLRETENRVQALKEALEKQGGIPRIIAKSHAMEVVFEQIRFAAGSNANTYVHGESGTGKELTAKAIHEMSDRKNGPFVAVNCSALPENLLESELFGHVKGSFTGAIKDKIGRIELAEKGTLFLDEIGDISPLIQVKLLRFLQEKEYERVGDSITRRANVRIITATNKNLRQLIQSGEFREDLYYRLNVFPIELPSLRSRKEDVAILTEHFISKYRKITNKEIVSISTDALLTLMDYNWPGNVRELENAIEHAFVTCQGTMIDIFNLPLEVRKNEYHMRAAIPHFANPSPFETSIRDPRRDMTKEQLISVLEQCRYNKSEASRILGVDRSTLWRWIKKWNLDS